MFRATSCLSSGKSIVSIQHLVYVTLCRWPFRVQIGKELSDLLTERSPTHSEIYQMLYWYNWFSWWWTRGCSKHVGNWNKYIEKNCASSSSFTKNHNKMHGQQNVRWWTEFRRVRPEYNVECQATKCSEGCVHLLCKHWIVFRTVKRDEIWDIRVQTVQKAACPLTPTPPKRVSSSTARIPTSWTWTWTLRSPFCRWS